MSGPLSNPQHEQFCQGFARGNNSSDAVRAAGFKTQQPHQQGRLLMMRQDVKDRVAEIKAELGDRREAEVADEEPTVAWVTKKYMLAIRLAEEREDRGSMIKGLDSIAKLKGYMVDRVETRSGPLDQYSADDFALIIELARQQKAALAAPVPAITVAAEIDDGG